MQKLLDLLEKIRPDVDFEEEKALIDDGILSSFDIINIVTDINMAFGVKINVADLIPDNFNTVEAMLDLIESF